MPALVLVCGVQSTQLQLVTYFKGSHLTYGSKLWSSSFKFSVSVHETGLSSVYIYVPCAQSLIALLFGLAIMSVEQ